MSSSPALFMVPGAPVSPTHDPSPRGADLGPEPALFSDEEPGEHLPHYPEHDNDTTPSSQFDTLTSTSSDQLPIVDLDLRHDELEAEAVPVPRPRVGRRGKATAGLCETDGQMHAEVESEQKELFKRFRSQSDPAPSMLEERTHSMPDLHKHSSSSTSPEVEEPTRYSHDLDSRLPTQRTALSQGDAPRGGGAMHGHGHGHGHTRHLSLVGVKQPRKKRSSRRGSVKQARSRSPPNLPPPPPPEGKREEAREECTPTSPTAVIPEEEGREMAGEAITVTSLQPRGGTLGFIEVMDTISRIDQELDQLTTSDPSPTHARRPVPIPVRPPLPPGYEVSEPTGGKEPELDFSCLDEDNVSGSSSEDQLEQGEEEAHSSTAQHSAAEAVLVLPSGSRATPEGGSEEPERLTHVSAKEGKVGELHGNGTSSAAGPRMPATDLTSFAGAGAGEVPRAPDERVRKQSDSKKHKQVMFREEVEDIPRYEPRVEQNTPVEEIPTTIAELKKKLFGTRETGVHTYRRDGSTSPQAQAAQTFRYVYRDSPPRNRSKSPEASPPAPPTSAQAEPDSSREHHYAEPWDQKPASKFVSRIKWGNGNGNGVIGAGEHSAAVAAAATAPEGHKAPSSVQFATVSSHEVPVAGDLELRNVHSLERQPRKERFSGPSLTESGGGKESSSLLESISTTLAAQAKYGSDSILTSSVTSYPEATGATPPQTSLDAVSPNTKRKQTSEVKWSARAELEKIRAEHKRDPQTSPHASPKSPRKGSPHTSPKSPRHNGQLPVLVRPVKRVGFAGFNGHPPRAAVSMDELERRGTTQVSYDSKSQAKILRSLV